MQKQKVQGDAFEIIYADGSVVAGSTKRQFSSAPNDGIQFVIVRYSDGSIVKHKAQDEYEYRGAVKPGSWTSAENYEALKARIAELSSLMVAPVDPRDRRRLR